MATGWGYGLNQLESIPEVSNHRHFQKKTMKNPGQTGMKMKLLSKFVKSNGKLERIPEHDVSINQSDPYFVSPSALIAEETKESEFVLCSSRSCAVTIFIIILIILGSAIAIGVILGTIGSSTGNGSSGTNVGQTTNNPNTLSTSPIVGFTSNVHIGNQTGFPCSSYTTIDDPTRHVNQTINKGPCDNGPIFNSSSGAAWIRFIGSGGTMIVMRPIGKNRCGAYFGIWSNVTLPTIPGVAINGIYCMGSETSDCLMFGSIAVMLCTGSPNFYIYLLPPSSACNSRYCTV